jgi:4'-phosphopantetheinyl transferase
MQINTEVEAPPLGALVWAAPPEELVLLADEVHIWRAWLGCDACLSALACWLSPLEIQRAMRFRFSVHRDRYIACRGMLRSLLGWYLRRDPGSLQFEVNDFGKPFLAADQPGDTIHFNVSHSHELALFAFVRGREIGVDLEHVRSVFDELAVAQRFFAPGEIAELQRLDPVLRVAGFFNCWTRKESYIKARGLGLSLPLDNFQVSLRPGSPAVLLSHDGDSDETLRWSFRDLSPGSGYVGALAIEGQDWHLRTFQWASGHSLAARGDISRCTTHRYEETDTG